MSQTHFFDTHCHLGGEELKGQAEVLAARAIAEGIAGLGLIAADEKSLDEVELLRVRLGNKFPGIKIISTAGIHPHDAKEVTPTLWARVQELARGPASAIGETGLDYHYNISNPELQKDWFDKHIELACETSKPLVIHCREAREDTLRMLDRESIHKHPNPGILHCFTEDLATAKKLLDLNFYISFSGIVSFKNAQSLRDIAAMVPGDRILIETDSPYLAPIPYRGKSNEPSFVKNVFTVIAGLRKESTEELKAMLWQNSCRVFGLTAN